jgi:23S rRNA (uracil1939-C5)-methyltransferase
LLAAERSEDVAYWLAGASEVEFFTNETLERVQVSIFVAPRTKAKQGSMERALTAIHSGAPTVLGLGALAIDPKTGPTGRVIAEAGKGGLSYQVLDESYWIARGGFFQVNRFLLPELVRLVTSHNGKPLSGELAWDLFAGVGLFSRVLARSFKRVVAVESNAQASHDNDAALKKIGAQHEAVAQTTMEFLRTAVVQRERPELIVLDPPRAGAGEQACELLNHAGAQTLIYVSCDPTTLVRDLAVLLKIYDVYELHMIDLFPQTFHMETVVVLERKT